MGISKYRKKIAKGYAQTWFAECFMIKKSNSKKAGGIKLKLPVGLGFFSKLDFLERRKNSAFYLFVFLLSVLFKDKFSPKTLSKTLKPFGKYEDFLRISKCKSNRV